MRSSRAFLLPAFLTLGACYVYAPSKTPAPTGAHIELFLSDRGRMSLGSSLGASTRSLSGALLERADSALIVAVDQTRTIDGAEYDWNGERVRIPVSAFDSLHVRRVSMLRSALVAGAIVGAASLVRVGMGLGSNGGGNRTPAPSPQ